MLTIAILTGLGFYENRTSQKVVESLTKRQSKIALMTANLASAQDKNAEVIQKIIEVLSNISNDIADKKRPILKNFVQELNLQLQLSSPSVDLAKKRTELMYQAIEASTLDDLEKELHVASLKKIILNLDQMIDTQAIQSIISEKERFDSSTQQETQVQGLLSKIKNANQQTERNKFYFALIGAFVLLSFLFQPRKMKVDKVVPNYRLVTQHQNEESASYRGLKNTFSMRFPGHLNSLWILETIEHDSSGQIEILNGLIFDYVKEISKMGEGPVVVYNATEDQNMLSIKISMEATEVLKVNLSYKILHDFVTNLDGEVQIVELEQTKITVFLPKKNV
jgi:hypothetical protein